MKPTVGRIVHYVLPDGTYPGEHRPAIVVRIWPGSDAIQLQVFVDGTNDYKDYSGSVWATSVKQDEETKAPRTWHWPEREDA